MVSGRLPAPKLWGLVPQKRAAGTLSLWQWKQEVQAKEAWIWGQAIACGGEFGTTVPQIFTPMERPQG